MNNKEGLTICISILGRSIYGTIVANSVSDETPKGHVDDPDDKGDKGCKGGTEGHEDGTDTGVTGAAEAKDCSKEGEYGCYRVEDHGRSQVVDSGCIKTIITGADVSVFEVRAEEEGETEVRT